MAIVNGTSGNDSLPGTFEDDVISGFGGNDTLNDGNVGGADVDTLDGGEGDDLITLNDARDTVIGGAGMDTLFLSFPPGPGNLTVNFYNLWANGSMAFGTGSITGIERLGPTVSGTMQNDVIAVGSNYLFDVALLGQEGDDVLVGGQGNDSLIGFTGADYLIGGLGNDTLDGGTGVANTLQGGAGDDVYDNVIAGDSVVEFADEGTDRVNTQLTVFKLPTHVENAFYTGGADFVGIGNADANQIYGSVGADTLFGLGGNDVLWGYTSTNGPNTGLANTLIGGTGNDLYFLATSGDSVIENADEGIDEVRTGAAAFTLPTNVENLMLFGQQASIGIGNAARNVMSGTTFSDLLVGLDGDDQLHGAPAFTINPADLANTMVGGRGDDSYFVYAVGDSVIELADEGADIVYSTLPVFVLPTNLESLVYSPFGAVMNFTGIGNAGDNAITGRTGRDTLVGGLGNDILIGGSGLANELIGGSGDDQYQSNAAGDSIIELAGGGHDSVSTDLNQFRLAANVEDLTFGGTGQFIGLGNNIDNRITGGLVSDVLYGLDGNDRLGNFSGSPDSVGDTLIGGTGDDVYAINSASHSVVERAGEGVDQVWVSIDVYTLPSFVENYYRFAQTGGTGIGNALDNLFEGYPVSGDDVFFGMDGNDTLQGVEGNDSLYGGNGNDTLFGGNGQDRFYFQGSESGTDLIIDFAPGQDLIYIRRAGFGATAVVDFISGTAPSPTGTNSALLYNTTTGAFSFDADGTGAGAAITLGQVTAGLSLSATDFVFY